ncbi:MAG TPA: hypothetical protein VFW33_03390 [Gemmataceae bacterium]|nr:hypothetical protein [Gemmataceae bacterium]
MSVDIACEKCDKRLKIPESVVGRAIKCPACGAVFPSTPDKVESVKAAAVAPVATAPAALEDEEEIVAVRKKPAVHDDGNGEAIATTPLKPVVDDDGDEVVPAAAHTADDEDDDVAVAAEAEEAPKKKRRTPWYVMLPLLVLALSGTGLAWLWVIGFTFLDMDRGLKWLTFDHKVLIGLATAGAITLLCLIFSLIPGRAWLRFLLVLFFLAVGYGGSFAAIHWWNDLPYIPNDQPDIDKNLPANPPAAGRGGVPPPTKPPFAPPQPEGEGQPAPRLGR